MIDTDNLARINTLYAEVRSIDAALANLANGGTIISMSISPGDPQTMPDELRGWNANVDTSYMPYPSQMLSAITGFLNERRVAIEHELTDLGVAFPGR